MAPAAAEVTAGALVPDALGVGRGAALAECALCLLVLRGSGLVRSDRVAHFTCDACVAAGARAFETADLADLRTCAPRRRREIAAEQARLRELGERERAVAERRLRIRATCTARPFVVRPEGVVARIVGASLLAAGVVLVDLGGGDESLLVFWPTSSGS
jgi:hypothetical protein